MIAAPTPGGAIFLTLVTFNRRPIFAETDNVKRLRQAAAFVKAEMPDKFEGEGLVVG